MNTYFKYILLAAFTLAATLFTACSETDAEADEGKTPYVQYVRKCNPEISDSLIVKASMGQRIAFIGHSLGDVREIWFNDQKAKLNPTLITSNAIIVDVPNVIPTEVTNTVRFITSKGQEFTYPFSVVVPNPVITSMSCQYANPGDVITLTGDYFIGNEGEVYVTFPGGAVATPKAADFTKTEIKVTVPEGATQEGYLTVTSIYGSTRTSFKYLETDGLFLTLDDGYTQPWGKGDTGTEDGISGRYVWFHASSNGAWNWSDALMYGYWAPTNTPIATGDLDKLALRFEVDCRAWSDVPMLIWFDKFYADGNISPDDNLAQCHWKPWNKNGVKSDYVTDGWVTVTIPLTEFKYNKDESNNSMSIGDISQYSNLNLMLFGAADGASPVDIRMDNFRIVPYNE